MNTSERNLLSRLQLVIDAVPFSASGTATSTGYGAIMFEEDMRALRPYVRYIFEGLQLQGNPNYEEGIDYRNPSKTLELLEKWVKWRASEGWEAADRYSIQRLESILQSTSPAETGGKK